jgi:hypothetical protein
MIPGKLDDDLYMAFPQMKSPICKKFIHPQPRNTKEDNTTQGHSGRGWLGTILCQLDIWLYVTDWLLSVIALVAGTTQGIWLAETPTR